MFACVRVCIRVCISLCTCFYMFAYLGVSVSLRGCVFVYFCVCVYLHVSFRDGSANFNQTFCTFKELFHFFLDSIHDKEPDCRVSSHTVDWASCLQPK